jgi:hypothetical protein
VNFSEQSIPCLYAKESGIISDLLGKIGPNQPLAVCMQTAKLYLWDSSKAQLVDFISEGFAVHPAKIGISLPVSDHLKPLLAKTPSSEIRDLFRNIQGAKTSKRSLAFLKKLEEHPLIKALQMEAPSETPGVKERVEALNALGSAIHTAIAEARAVLQQKADAPLKKLIRLKALDSLLFGSTGGVGQFCLNDAEPILASIEQLTTYKAAYPQGALIDLVLDGQIANQMAGKAWEEFLKDLEPLIENGKISAGQVQAFKQQIALLKQSGALPFWLTFYQGHTEVRPFTSREEKTLERFHQILENGIAETDQGLVNTLLKEKGSIQQMESQMSRFADPVQFEAAWKELEARVDEWRSLALCDAIKQSPPIVQSIAYQTLREGVTLLDIAIKTMKASPQFEPLAKVEIFKRMVSSYVELMKSIGKNLVGANRIPHHRNWPLDTYFNRFDRVFNGLKASNDPQMLRASDNFSVSAAIITAKTAFERHLPASLEDVMTTAHQNLEAFLAIANEGILAPDQIFESHLPSAVQAAIQNIEGTDWGRRIERVGIEMSEEEIVVRYNVPLRNHSGHIDLRFNLQSGKLSFDGQLLGQARQRWGETAQWIEVLQASSIFAAQSPISQNDLELRFSWKIASPDRLKDAIREYVAMAEYSLGDQEYETVIEGILERWKNRPECENLISGFLQFPNTAERFYLFYLKNFSLSGPYALEKERLAEALLSTGFYRFESDFWTELVNLHANSSKKEIAEIIQKTQIPQEQKIAIQKWVDESPSEKPLFDLLLELVKRVQKTPNHSSLGRICEMVALHVRRGVITEEFIQLAKITSSETLFEAFVEKGYLYEEALTFLKSSRFPTFSLVQKLVDRGATYQYDANTRKLTFNAELLGQRDDTRLETLVDWTELLQTAGILTSQSFKDPHSGDQFYSWTLAFPGDFSRILSEHAKMLAISLSKSKQAVFEELFDRWKDQRELPLMIDSLLKNPKAEAEIFYKHYLRNFLLNGLYPLNHENLVTAIAFSSNYLPSYMFRLFDTTNYMISKEALIAQVEASLVAFPIEQERKKAILQWIHSFPSETPIADLMFQITCMIANRNGNDATTYLRTLAHHGYRNQAMVDFVKNRPTPSLNQALIFETFIQNGFGHKEAFELAHQYTLNPDPQIQRLALDLFTGLVKAGATEEVYERALQAAFEAQKTTSNSYEIAPLLDALIENGYEVEKIAKWVVEDLINTKEEGVNRLLEKLVDLGYGDEHLLKWTIATADSDLYADQWRALRFFQKLARKGVGLWEARQVALRLLVSEYTDMRKEAMKLLLILNKAKAK